MNFRFLTRTAVCAAIVFSSRHALAWGDEGHRIVALIAEHYLTPVAQTEVQAILSADADTLTAPDLASRATWADKYRDSDRNTTKARYTATQQWHFVDIEISAPDFDGACFGHPQFTGYATAGPAKDCVVDKINQFASELAALPRTDPEALAAFKFLLHFVGDVHQPLHSSDNHDRGGNSVPVIYATRTVATPLHSYWDTAVVSRLGRQPKSVADALITRFDSNAADWARGTPEQWAEEAFQVAGTVAYNLPSETVPDGHGVEAYELDYSYERAATDAAAIQLAKAGMRLAAMLNSALVR